MCYAIGTPNVPASKLRCKSSKGERRRASDAHAYNAKKQEAVVEGVRGVEIKPAHSPRVASPSPYPVTVPHGGGVNVVSSPRFGWSGMSPGQLIGGKKSKKPKPEPEPKPEPVDGVEPEPERGGVGVPDRSGVGVPEPPRSPAMPKEPEPVDEVKPEPVGEDEASVPDRSEASVPEPKRCPATPKEPVKNSAKPKVLTATTLSTYQKMSFDEFSDYVEGRTNNPDDALYIPADDQPETRAEAINAIAHVLHEKNPQDIILYDEKLAAEGKTPSYHLAETLSPTQREAVARASSFRAQQYAVKKAKVWDRGKAGNDVITASVGVGACVSLAADLRFANAVESGDVPEVQEAFDTVNRLMESKRDIFGYLENSTDDKSTKLLLAGGSKLAQRSPSLFSHFIKETIIAGAIDHKEIDRIFEKSGVPLYPLERMESAKSLKYTKSVLSTGDKVQETCTKQERDKRLETYQKMCSIMTFAERQKKIKNGEKRGTVTGDATALLYSAVTMREVQREAAEKHAEFVKREMEKIAPRYDGKYSSAVRINRTMTKKAQENMDRAGSMLNKEMFERVLSVANRTENRLEVGLLRSGKAYFSAEYHRREDRSVNYNMRTDGEFATTLHETMHMVEQSYPTVGGSSIQFLRNRVDGLQTVSMPGRNGIAAPDSFYSPYAGKLYIGETILRDYYPVDSEVMLNAGTEILSTGTERSVTSVWDYKSMMTYMHKAMKEGKTITPPVTALYDDNEHDAYSVGVMTGRARRDLKPTL